jgi:hypothetical protein
MQIIRIPANASAEQLEEAYALGMLRKEQLVDGAYYKGRCRNASVARWNATSQEFLHQRLKFNSRFVEGIKHPADEKNFDVFVAREVTEPSELEIVSDEAVARWNTPRAAA